MTINIYVGSDNLNTQPTFSNGHGLCPLFFQDQQYCNISEFKQALFTINRTMSQVKTLRWNPISEQSKSSQITVHCPQSFEDYQQALTKYLDTVLYIPQVCCLQCWPLILLSLSSHMPGEKKDTKALRSNWFQYPKLLTKSIFP